MKETNILLSLAVLAILLSITFPGPPKAIAHCDGMDGPEGAL
jgi:hypothetical protein